MVVFKERGVNRLIDYWLQERRKVKSGSLCLNPEKRRPSVSFRFSVTWVIKELRVDSAGSGGFPVTNPGKLSKVARTNY